MGFAARNRLLIAVFELRGASHRIVIRNLPTRAFPTGSWFVHPRWVRSAIVAPSCIGKRCGCVVTRQASEPGARSKLRARDETFIAIYQRQPPFPGAPHCPVLYRYKLALRAVQGQASSSSVTFGYMRDEHRDELEYMGGDYPGSSSPVPNFWAISLAKLKSTPV